MEGTNADEGRRMTKGRSGFGTVRKLPSGRHQARYVAPDGHRYSAPTTFGTVSEARMWLALRHSEIVRGKWMPPTHVAPRLTLAEYADSWLEDRDLKPRTRAHYRSLLDRQILPALGGQEVSTLSPPQIRRWYASLEPSRPTLRAHAYSLLRAILATAVHDEVLTSNPCHIRGAGSAPRVKKIEPATLPELEAIVRAMPPKHRLLVLLAAWCGLRFGELSELRRGDVDLKAGVIKVRRAKVRVNGENIVGPPKSQAGTRDVAIPPHLLPALQEHLAAHAQAGRDGLLFPGEDGGHLATSSLYGRASRPSTRQGGPARSGFGFYGAREAAGRPDLRFHDLRHTGAVLAASTGATLAELMGRLGHSTPQAAMRYQHAAKGRDAEIARLLSGLAEGN